MSGGTRLALGTVQWGMTYGIANRTGRPCPDEVQRMLQIGREHGVQLLDTAYAYGEAEKVLGAQGAAACGYQIVTKTRPLRVQHVCEEDVRSVMAGFDESLAALGSERVYGLLVHCADVLMAPGGERIWSALEAMKAEGRVGKIGVSVYHPTQLQRILDRYPVDLVQLPFSVYDQRFQREGLLSRLQRMQIEVHARSAFLQGLLLLAPDQLPSRFDRVRTHQADLHNWFRGRGLTAVEGCLLYCLQQPGIGRVVVGCETAAQLKGILDASAAGNTEALSELAGFALHDKAMIDPSVWWN